MKLQFAYSRASNTIWHSSEIQKYSIDKQSNREWNVYNLIKLLQSRETFTISWNVYNLVKRLQSRETFINLVKRLQSRETFTIIVKRLQSRATYTISWNVHNLVKRLQSRETFTISWNVYNLVKRLQSRETFTNSSNVENLVKRLQSQQNLSHDLLHIYPRAWCSWSSSVYADPTAWRPNRQPTSPGSNRSRRTRCSWLVPDVRRNWRRSCAPWDPRSWWSNPRYRSQRWDRQDGTWHRSVLKTRTSSFRRYRGGSVGLFPNQYFWQQEEHPATESRFNIPVIMISLTSIIEIARTKSRVWTAATQHN